MNANTLREDRIGVMVHYSAGDFAGTVAWCKDPKSKVSYNAVIAPDGAVVVIVPWTLRAWHAGVCKPSSDQLHYTDANSAFEGIALSGGPEFGPPTDHQRKALAMLLQERFYARKWSPTETWRIVSHASEAWPRGRKDDPEGPHHDWLLMADVRRSLTEGA